MLAHTAPVLALANAVLRGSAAAAKRPALACLTSWLQLSPDPSSTCLMSIGALRVSLCAQRQRQPHSLCLRHPTTRQPPQHLMACARAGELMRSNSELLDAAVAALRDEGCRSEALDLLETLLEAHSASAAPADDAAACRRVAQALLAWGPAVESCSDSALAIAVARVLSALTHRNAHAVAGARWLARWLAR